MSKIKNSKAKSKSKTQSKTKLLANEIMKKVERLKASKALFSQ